MDRSGSVRRRTAAGTTVRGPVAVRPLCARRLAGIPPSEPTKYGGRAASDRGCPAYGKRQEPSGARPVRLRRDHAPPRPVRDHDQTARRNEAAPTPD